MKEFDLELEIMNQLHLFNRDCLKQPYKGEPMERRMRKAYYARKIIQLVKIAFNTKT